MLLGKVGELVHKIWTPSPGDPIDLELTVERELLELYNKLNVVKILYDKTHLIQTMLRMKKKGLPVESYEQTTTNMVQASQLLYELLKNNNFETYPDDDARKHIQMAVAETTSRGFRIVKNKASKRHKIDYAIALAMACYGAVSSGGADISIPLLIESPFSDATAYTSQEQLAIPFALRSDD